MLDSFRKKPSRLISFEILFRFVGDELTIYTQLVEATDSFTAENFFHSVYRNCDVLGIKRVTA